MAELLFRTLSWIVIRREVVARDVLSTSILLYEQSRDFGTGTSSVDGEL
jgi:hypothetical protein